MCTWMRLTMLFVLSTTLTSCLYRMPNEGDPDVIPTTNNSLLINESPQNWMPGASY